LLTAARQQAGIIAAYSGRVIHGIQSVRLWNNEMEEESGWTSYPPLSAIKTNAASLSSDYIILHKKITVRFFW
jgi:heme/copper-type cytochrome/quinol oxidase subunit 1